MNEITREYIVSIQGERKNKLLQKIRLVAGDDDIPIISEDVEDVIAFLIKAKNIKTVLEIGAAVGYSSCFMADVIGNDANITTIERDHDLYVKAVENIQLCGYSHRISITEGDGELLMDELIEKNIKFDMVFLDGAKGHYQEMSEKAYTLLNKGAILVCDDVLFRGMITSELPVVRRKITIVKRLRKFLSSMMKDDRWQCAVLPVGDGVLVCVKH